MYHCEFYSGPPERGINELAPNKPKDGLLVPKLIGDIDGEYAAGLAKRLTL